MTIAEVHLRSCQARWTVSGVLFNDVGLSIENAQFVLIPPEFSELSNIWKKLPGNIRKSLGSFEQGNIYQVVIKAVPSSNSSKNLNLMELPVNVPERRSFYGIKYLAKRLLPERYHSRAKSLAYKMGFKD